ncbi:MAG: SprT family zinc-dependent metalloprotease [Verrucomicrobiota bacterium]
MDLSGVSTRWTSLSKPRYASPETVPGMSERTRHIDSSVGPCLLKRSDRKTLSISVLPNGDIELIAPRDASPEAIRAQVLRRKKWITAKRAEFAALNAHRTPLRYCSGATHHYLGKQYRLKIRKANCGSVKLRGGFFQILAVNHQESEIKALLGRWYRERAREQFEKRLQFWEPWCGKNGLPRPRLALRVMPKRWGSAQADGRIFLNPALVCAPSICIDYVIAHEICHLQHPNHDKQFYRVLSTLVPDWKAIKQRLENTLV